MSLAMYAAPFNDNEEKPNTIQEKKRKNKTIKRREGFKNNTKIEAMMKTIHNNVGVEKIKELLGHKHIETTLIYGQNTSKDLQLSVQTLDKKDTKTDNKQ